MRERLYVLVLDVDLRIPGADNRKAKRAVVQSIVRTLDGWKGVAAAEVGHLERWQRTRIGVCIVGGSVSHVRDVADSVDRHLWTNGDVEVISTEEHWTPIEE